MLSGFSETRITVCHYVFALQSLIIWLGVFIPMFAIDFRVFTGNLNFLNIKPDRIHLTKNDEDSILFQQAVSHMGEQHIEKGGRIMKTRI